MITRLSEFYYMLTERAFDVNDTQIYVLLRSSSKKELKLCLYDHVNKKIVGYITSSKDERYDYYIMDRATADKGWGPFMYTLMLYSVYPLGLKPSAKIRPAAINVYKKFISNPKMVTVPVSDTDLNYTSTWEPDVELLPRESPEETDIINTVYKMAPEPWFQPFIMESERIIKEKNINVNEIFKTSLDVWQYNYDSSRASLAEGATIMVPVKDVEGKYLIVNDKTRSVEFLIQDKSKIFGYAELIKEKSYYRMVNVAAEPSWGPYLYDTVMLFLDKPVRPNRSLTSEAWAVWNNYCNNRPDVIKKELGSDTWDTVDLDHKYVTTSTIVEPVNYLYTINDPKRKSETYDWLHKTQDFIQQWSSKVSGFVEKRFNYAKQWFNTKYDTHLAA